MSAVPARVLVVGRSGQLASALAAATWPAGIQLSCRGRDSLDLRRPDAVAEAVAGGGWSAVVNAAAYTAVDRAETEVDAAFALNRDGPAALAEACARAGLPLVHLSTDYVFDGSREAPWREEDPVAPLSVYGTSKAAGEEAVRRRWERHVILRSSWVFSAAGGNFVKTMLRLAAKRDEIAIVDDQRGRPTAAADLAGAVVAIVDTLLSGKTDGFGSFHFANAGAVSWYGFACEVFRQAALRGFAPIPRLRPIRTDEYPTAARRPMNSVLDTQRIARIYGIVPRPWEDALAETLDVLVGPPRADRRAGAPR